MKALNFLNGRTLLVLLVSQLAVFFSFKFHIRFDLDLLLFSLAVAFPLAFSIQSAFKRRDRALEYFSLYKGGVTALVYSFRLAEDLPVEKKAEINKTLEDMTSHLINQLETRNGNADPLRDNMNKVVSFIEANREEISNRTIQRMVRYLRDVTESSAYLLSLVNHRTMLGLRLYAIVFITIFPALQAPIVITRLELLVPQWSFYLLVAFSSLVLVTMSNFQKMIEYPFDPEGVDNIKARDFRP